jgi:hypothetical protein
MSKLAVIAPCFYPDTSPARLLAESCQKHGLDLHLFGVGQPWRGDLHHHFEAAPQAVEALPPHVEAVLFTDAADVFVMAGETEILDKYLRWEAPLLLSAEQGLYPWGMEEFRYQSTAPLAYSPWAHPNGGGWIGRREGLAELLRRVGREEWQEAQGRWVKAFSRGDLGVCLDHLCSIFQTMSQSSGDQLELRRSERWESVFHSHRFHNTHTGSFPCLLHFNGRCGGDGMIERWYERAG